MSDDTSAKPIWAPFLEQSKTHFTFPDGTVGPGRWDPKTQTVVPMTGDRAGVSEGHPEPSDWEARRRSVLDRWPESGLPMTRFEMASAVEWDAIEKEPEKAAYHRRGLLNVIAELMDRAGAPPQETPGLREAVENLIAERRRDVKPGAYFWLALDKLEAALSGSPQETPPPDGRAIVARLLNMPTGPSMEDIDERMAARAQAQRFLDGVGETPPGPLDAPTRDAFEKVAEALEEAATLPKRPTQFRRGWADAHRVAAAAIRAALHTETSGEPPGLDARPNPHRWWMEVICTCETETTYGDHEIGCPRAAAFRASEVSE